MAKKMPSYGNSKKGGSKSYGTDVNKATLIKSPITADIPVKLKSATTPHHG